MRRHDGHDVPISLVPALDKKKDKVVRQHIKTAEKLAALLLKLKNDAMKDIEAIREAMYADNKVKEGSKGNMLIQTFDKSLKIEVAIAERIEFSDLINVAQEKINQYLKEKTGNGIDSEIAELINLAFKTTKGKLDTKRILSLFKLQIKHSLWIEAMELLKKSIETNSSKTYIRFWKKDENGSLKSIVLDIANV